MNLYAKGISVLALSVLLVAVNACKKSANQSEDVSRTSVIIDEVSSPSATPEADTRFKPPTQYRDEPITVEMDCSIERNGTRFIVKGHVREGASLPDGVRIFVHLKGSFGIEGDGEAIVRDGQFECSPFSNFDDSKDFPGGDWSFQVFLHPTIQTTAIQAIFGKGGANLTGAQVRVDDRGGKYVSFGPTLPTGACILENDSVARKFYSPEASELMIRIGNEIERRSKEFGALYRELQNFKDDPSFWERGDSSPVDQDWLLRVRKAGEADKSGNGNFGKRIAAKLENLSASYRNNKGIETERTQSELQSFFRAYQKIDSQFQSLGTPYFGISQFISKLGNGQVSLKDAMKTAIVIRDSDESFKVTGTTEEHVFYTRETAGRFVQIAVKRNSKKFYGNGSLLREKTFQVAGVGHFSTVMGAGVDAVIFKVLPE